MQKLFNYLIIGTIIPLTFSACVSSMAASIGIDTTGLKEQGQEFAAGHYKQAAKIAIENKDTEKEIDEEHLLSTLNGANTLLYAKDYATSISLFNDAERSIKFHREELLTSTTSDYLAKILLNDAAIDYHASIWDTVLVNTYKSISYMAQGRMQEARVELNRAIDRQRRAKEEYSIHIKKQEKAIAKKKRSESAEFSKSMENPKLNGIIENSYSNLYNFQAYPDFINPFTTYLAGIFFTIDGDLSKASLLLKNAYGMMPKNKTAKDDFIMVEEALNNGRSIKNKYVWIIYENGLGPIKTQFKVNIPLYMVSSNVSYTGLALPKLKNRNIATIDMSIYEGSKLLSKTQNIADMDRVIQTEFKYRYKYIVARALMSTILKTNAQYQIYRKLGVLAGLGASIFQFATTQSDTRIWSTVGKEFQIARVNMPSSRKLVLKAGKNNIDVSLGENAKHSIIYVRIPTANSIPSVSVINF
jgi:hypothetical protein